MYARRLLDNILNQKPPYQMDRNPGGKLSKPLLSLYICVNFRILHSISLSLSLSLARTRALSLLSCLSPSLLKSTRLSGPQIRFDLLLSSGSKDPREHLCIGPAVRNTYTWALGGYRLDAGARKQVARKREDLKRDKVSRCALSRACMCC
jgi:hypothetical protein